MDILALVEQQHRAQVADAFVGEPGARSQLQALQLAEVRRVAEHVNVQQLRDVPTPPHRVLLAERAANVGALLVYNRALLGGGARRANLTN